MENQHISESLLALLKLPSHISRMPFTDTRPATKFAKLLSAGRLSKEALSLLIVLSFTIASTNPHEIAGAFFSHPNRHDLETFLDFSINEAKCYIYASDKEKTIAYRDILDVLLTYL